METIARVKIPKATCLARTWVPAAYGVVVVAGGGGGGGGGGVTDLTSSIHNWQTPKQG